MKTLSMYNRLIIGGVLVATITLIFAHAWWLFFDTVITRLVRQESKNSPRGPLFYASMYLIATTVLIIVTISALVYFEFIEARSAS